MKWSEPADKTVVESVVAAFRAPGDDLHAVLAPISLRQWQRSFYWLDASGMALYFLDHIESLGVASAIPDEALARLQQNRADNRLRSASMLAEFGELNRAFQQADADFCNLKGFTLCPDSCSDPTLRCQLDFDFLVDGAHIGLCRDLLVQRGYVLRGATNTVWEFKRGCEQIADIADFYKPRSQRCVEIHFVCTDTPPHRPVRDPRLDRLCRTSRSGLDFPALSPVDQFLGQATHLFSHLCGPCTRLSWLLEFTRHMTVHFHDEDFWNEVHRRAEDDRTTGIALRVATTLAGTVFGAALPSALQADKAAQLPDGIRLWTQCYGRRALLADFPGTKLHLLLREQLNHDAASWNREKRSMLLPLNRPPRILHVDRNASVYRRLRGELLQLRYILFRLRFHVVEGLRYKVEARRWHGRLMRRQLRLHAAQAPRTQSPARPSC